MAATGRGGRGPGRDLRHGDRERGHRLPPGRPQRRAHPRPPARRDSQPEAAAAAVDKTLHVPPPTPDPDVTAKRVYLTDANDKRNTNACVLSNQNVETESGLRRTCDRLKAYYFLN